MYRLWMIVFPAVWSLCTEEERMELLPLIESFITHDLQRVNTFHYNSLSMDDYQLSIKSSRSSSLIRTKYRSHFTNIIQLMLESFMCCTPVLILSLPVYLYCSTHYNCGYIVCHTLSHYSLRVDSSIANSIQLCLFDIYVFVRHSHYE